MGRRQQDGDSAGQLERLALLDRQVWPTPVQPANLDDQVTVVERSRDVDENPTSVGPSPVDRSRQRGGGVDDHQVARREQIGQVMEPPVRDHAGPSNEQPHSVARHSSALGWCRRLATRRQ